MRSITTRYRLFGRLERICAPYSQESADNVMEVSAPVVLRLLDCHLVTCAATVGFFLHI
jgi:hypothetical protein